MIYEYAAEPFSIAGWLWIPLSIIGLAVLAAIVLSIVFCALGDWNYQDVLAMVVLAGIVVVFTAVLGIALPSSATYQDWRSEQIKAAIQEQGYTQVKGTTDWTANLNGDFRTGTASISDDDIVTIKDLTDLEVVE